MPVEQRFSCTWQPRCRNPKGSTCRQESAPGSSAELPHAVGIPDAPVVPGRWNSMGFYRTKQRKGRVSGENTTIKSNLLPAACTFQPIKQKDWGGRGGRNFAN